MGLLRKNENKGKQRDERGRFGIAASSSVEQGTVVEKEPVYQEEVMKGCW